jgi:hypothetical protein
LNFSTQNDPRNHGYPVPGEEKERKGKIVFSLLVTEGRFALLKVKKDDDIS